MRARGEVRAYSEKERNQHTGSQTNKAARSQAGRVEGAPRRRPRREGRFLSILSPASKQAPTIIPFSACSSYSPPSRRGKRHLSAPKKG